MSHIHIPWLEPHEAFPPPEQAMGADTPWPGLLAAGGVLDAQTLKMAYACGIFPWCSPEDPLLWWSTDPRMVLKPEQFKVSQSFAKTLKAFKLNQQSQQAEIRIDSAFTTVMQHCAAPRKGQDGSWISPQLIEAYTDLHQQGLAHSVETWINGNLVGGLYVVALGKAVFGESMFALQANASKIALAALVCLCKAHSVAMIDCQQETAHLASLGAAPIARADFLQSIQQTQRLPPIQWQFDAALWAHLPT